MTAKDKIDQALDGDGEVAPWERGPQASVDEISAPVEAPQETPANLSSALALEEEAEYTPAAGRVYAETLDFAPNEITIPRLRLAQALTEEVGAGNARVGQWLLSGEGAVDKAEIVILGVSRVRELRDRQTQETHCRSNDGIHGTGDPGGLCAKCPMAQWGERNPKTGKSSPPPCAEGFSYQVVSLSHGDGAMALLDFKRTAIGVAKKINTALQLRRARGFVAVLSAQSVPSPAGGSYQTPVVDIRPITAEEKALVNELA